MTRKATPLLLAVLLLCISLGSAVAQDPVTVKISPSTISEVAKGPRNLTVHTDIPYVANALGTVTLQPEPLCTDCSATYAVDTFSDDRGNLVAKFTMEDVHAWITSSQSETLTLLFTADIDGTPLSGTDTVRIVTCSRLGAGASFPAGTGTFRWSRFFSRVCSQP